MLTSRLNQFKLNLSLILGRRHLDLLIVKSGHGEDLSLVATGLKFRVYDPERKPAVWCIRFWIHRVFRVRDLPLGSRTIVSLVRVMRASRVISTDQYRNLGDSDEFLPGTEIYLVQHGTYIDQTTSVMKRDKEVADRSCKLTLFSISHYDITNYRRWGVRPMSVLPVGTLKNCVYVNSIAPDQTNKAETFDVCIIEKGIILSPDSELKQLRLEMWRRFLTDFNAYCSIYRPRVIIALTAGSDAEGSESWIRGFLNYEFEVARQSTDRFATYKAIDSSNLSIGQASTTLTEALSRQRKILNFNYSSNSFWDLPGSGIMSLNRPTQNDLIERIELLRSLSWDSYWARASETLRSFTIKDPSQTIRQINHVLTAGPSSVSYSPGRSAN